MLSRKGFSYFQFEMLELIGKPEHGMPREIDIFGGGDRRVGYYGKTSQGWGIQRFKACMWLLDGKRCEDTLSKMQGSGRLASRASWLMCDRWKDIYWKSKCSSNQQIRS